jgi:acetyl esterase/lipase
MFDLYAPAGGAYSSADEADLSGLSPVLVVAAGYDDLLPGAIWFSDAARAAETHVDLETVPDAIHGLLELPPALPAASSALDRMAGFLTDIGKV